MSKNKKDKKVVRGSYNPPPKAVNLPQKPTPPPPPKKKKSD
jgi:hypothetical protein